MMAKPTQFNASHTCLDCGWFQFKGSNRGCVCPTKLAFSNGRCANWKSAYSTLDKIMFTLKLKEKPKRSIIK